MTFSCAEDFSSNGVLTLASGTYTLDAPWVPVVADITFSAHDVTFPAEKPNLTNFIPFQGGPVWSQSLIRKTYAADFAGYGNIFHTAAYARSEIPAGSMGGANIVAIFGGADSHGDTSSVWASNFVGYANNPTGVSIASEMNFGALIEGGKAYGLVLATAGYHAAESAIQVQANNEASRAKNGIIFNSRAHGLVTGALIKLAGDPASSPAAYGIDFAGYSFSGAEMRLPSMEVEATQAETVNRLSIRGAVTNGRPRLRSVGSDTNIGMDFLAKGNGPFIFASNGVEQFRIAGSTGPEILQAGAGVNVGTLSVRGAATNADVALLGKGTGGVRIQSGDGTMKIRVNNTGIGFNASTPIAKPEVTGSRDGNAALASLLSALASYGLIIDGTTA